MSTPASPLEQLEQQSATAQPSQAAPGSNLSPLEQLEQQSAKATTQPIPSGQVTNIAGNTNLIPNARIRNMTVDPTKDFHSPGEAFLSGAKTGVEAAAIPASAIGLGEAGPVIEHLAEGLPSLDRAYKVLKTIGAATSGAGGTLYTLQHLKDVLKIIGGSSK